jgi:hypothetical protein
MSSEQSGYCWDVEAQGPTGRRRNHGFGLAVVLALCAASAVRLSGAALLFLPWWVALIAVVFAGLEVLSVAWNMVRRAPWNERTFIDHVSDALVWLPWP